MVVDVGIEPTLGPHLGHTVYKTVDASNYINQPTGSGGGIWTHEAKGRYVMSVLSYQTARTPQLKILAILHI